MTWAEIMRAAGGRTRGNNHHFVEVGKPTGQAKERLAEIRRDDVSELFSLRLDATKRICGIRDGRALKPLWYDPHHGTNARAVYPVQDRWPLLRPADASPRPLSESTVTVPLGSA